MNALLSEPALQVMPGRYEAVGAHLTLARRWRHRSWQRVGVQRTVREYARAGAAAVLIEDKVWPQPLGLNGAKLVVKRNAAVELRSSHASNTNLARIGIKLAIYPQLS